MNSFIFGFHRFVWWPKCTPASSRSFIAIPGKVPPYLLAFTELEALACAGQPVLLAFLDARIGRQQAILLQQFPQLGVEFDQRARDAEAHRAGLAVHAATGDRGEDVELLTGFGHQQWPFHLDAQRVGGEEVLELSVVDGDGPGSGAKKHAGGGCLPAACSVVLDIRQSYATSIFAGCWAEWGCSAPAYTLSFRYIASPILVFGSMPRTASSTRRTGWRLRTSTARSSRRPPSKPLCRRYSFCDSFCPVSFTDPALTTTTWSPVSINGV